MMHEKDFSEKILLGVTTYSGDFESRLILSKVLRHMRSKNGKNIFLLVVSDGHITDPQVHKLADAVLDRPGPCGLHQGELDSIWEIIRFAQAKGYTKLIKSAGDIIMTHPNWAQTVMKRFDESGARIMSTHWFHDGSWIVGTKFFVADTDFLAMTMPQTIDRPNLEEAFTEKIARHVPVQQGAYLINTNTGERHEVTHELKAWGWEHAHRLSKFVRLDESSPMLERYYGKWLLYPALRLKRDISRSIKKLVAKK